MTKTISSHPSFIHFLKRIFFLVLFATALTSCESRKTIVNALDEREANEILVFLSNRGIDAYKVQAVSEGAGGAKAVLWNISVESSQANEAMSILNQAGLPRKRGQNLLGLFSNVGLVPSALQDKVRYQAGLAEQIASTIRKIDGVLEADVQISTPDEDPLNPNAPKQKITASVYVKHSGVLDDPNAHLTTRIKRLVAGSINGLDFDNVTVIGDRARFSETGLGFQGTINEEDRPYVNVWSVILAKQSLTRFRLIFFSFTILLLLLLFAVMWSLWKFLPILNKLGGIKQLFSLQPLPLENVIAVETESKKKKGKNKKKKKAKKEEPEEEEEEEEESEDEDELSEEDEDEDEENR